MQSTVYQQQIIEELVASDTSVQNELNRYSERLGYLKSVYKAEPQQTALEITACKLDLLHLLESKGYASCNLARDIKNLQPVSSSIFDKYRYECMENE